MNFDANPPLSPWRICVFFVYGIGGLLFTLFPLTGFLYLLPEPNEVPVARALVGMVYTAIVLFPAFFFAAPISNKDRKLFGTTPLTPRIYYRRVLASAVPLYVSVSAIGPALAPVILALLPPEEGQEGFRWTATMVAESVVAYYAFLLTPAALVVWAIRLETPGVLPSNLTNARRNGFVVAGIYGLFFLVWIFRAELYRGLASAVEFALNHGAPGVLALGFFSPGSVLAIQGREAIPASVPPMLISLWGVLIAFDASILWRCMRRDRPRREISDALARGDAQPRKPQRVSHSPVAADHFRERLISVTEYREESRAYDSSGTPECRYARLLPYLQYAPSGHGAFRNVIVVVYRWPWLSLIGVFWIISASDMLIERKTSALPYLVQFASFYANLYAGVRWTWPLRSSLSLPLRMHRLAFETCKTRWLYFLICDAAVAGLTMFGSDTNQWIALLMFVVLLLARFCGQIRSCLSVFYGAGRKRGSWLYELPLLFAPVISLAIFALSSLWIPSQIAAAVALSSVLFWPVYGLGIAWWCYRDNDWSLPRASSSYRPGVPSNESI